eukprot:gene18814-54978_t
MADGGNWMAPVAGTDQGQPEFVDAPTGGAAAPADPPLSSQPSRPTGVTGSRWVVRASAEAPQPPTPHSPPKGPCDYDATHTVGGSRDEFDVPELPSLKFPDIGKGATLPTKEEDRDNALMDLRDLAEKVRIKHNIPDLEKELAEKDKAKKEAKEKGEKEKREKEEKEKEEREKMEREKKEKEEKEKEEKEKEERERKEKEEKEKQEKEEKERAEKEEKEKKEKEEREEKEEMQRKETLRKDAQEKEEREQKEKKEKEETERKEKEEAARKEKEAREEKERRDKEEREQKEEEDRRAGAAKAAELAEAERAAAAEQRAAEWGGGKEKERWRALAAAREDDAAAAFPRQVTEPVLPAAFAAAAAATGKRAEPPADASSGAVDPSATAAALAADGFVAGRVVAGLGALGPLSAPPRIAADVPGGGLGAAPSTFGQKAPPPAPLTATVTVTCTFGAASADPTRLAALSAADAAAAKDGLRRRVAAAAAVVIDQHPQCARRASTINSMYVSTPAPAGGKAGDLPAWIEPDSAMEPDSTMDCFARTVPADPSTPVPGYAPHTAAVSAQSVITDRTDGPLYSGPWGGMSRPGGREEDVPALAAGAVLLQNPPARLPSRRHLEQRCRPVSSSTYPLSPQVCGEVVVEALLVHNGAAPALVPLAGPAAAVPAAAAGSPDRWAQHWDS